jgi:hypothetical protein
MISVGFSLTFFSMLERSPIVNVKEHIKRYQFAYGVAAGIGVAGITYLIMRGVASQPINVGNVPDAAHGGIVSVMGKKAVMNNVSFISANRQGSPSWVIRCLETDKIFTSQRKAALAMNIPQPDLSHHLNGLTDSVRDLHFERICLAA